MRLWTIPLVYIVASFGAGYGIPRLEERYLPALDHSMAVASAQAFFSAVSSGMMALTGIVFAVAFVLVQFSAVAYSPRLTLLLVGDPKLFHALGIFVATFIYSLAALLWVDRSKSGDVPYISAMIVISLVILSMLAFARAIQIVNNLQITSVLQTIGQKGSAVIGTMFRAAGSTVANGQQAVLQTQLAPIVQSLVYSGGPQVIAALDTPALLKLARGADATIVFDYAVGDTVLIDAKVLAVHGTAGKHIPEQALWRAIHLARGRTFEQDPKYAIRLLVDIAIRALSPAVNDPTTAVQSLDQIEDLLLRLSCCELDIGRVRDANGVVRLIYPVPTWDDYLDLAFDEIRQFGTTSVQVMRRMHAALNDIAEVAPASRRESVLHYIEQLKSDIARSGFDPRDRAAALQEDRQGLGLSRHGE